MFNFSGSAMEFPWSRETWKFPWMSLAHLIPFNENEAPSQVTLELPNWIH